MNAEYTWLSRSGKAPTWDFPPGVAPLYDRFEQTQHGPSLVYRVACDVCSGEDDARSKADVTRFRRQHFHGGKTAPKTGTTR